MPQSLDPSISEWRGWGVSVAGPGHHRSGLPNQDAWICRHYRWGSVAVVSDGVGSKPHADHGARASCISVCEAAKVYRRHPEAVPGNLLRLIHANWLVRVAPFSPAECSATCLFVIQMADMLLLGRLGDGLIGVCGDSPKNSFLIRERKEESFSNVTSALGETFSLSSWETVFLKAHACSAVVICTDGVADDLLPGKEMDFVKELSLSYREMSRRKGRREVLGWLNDWPVPKHSDDKTVVCLFKKGATS